jgi:hypothetical protein
MMTQRYILKEPVVILVVLPCIDPVKQRAL